MVVITVLQNMRSTAQVLEELGVGARTLERVLAARPELKPRTFGGSFTWSDEDVDRVRSAIAERGRSGRTAAAQPNAPAEGAGPCT